MFVKFSSSYLGSSIALLLFWQILYLRITPLYLLYKGLYAVINALKAASALGFEVDLELLIRTC